MAIGAESTIRPEVTVAKAERKRKPPALMAGSPARRGRLKEKHYEGRTTDLQSVALAG